MKLTFIVRSDKELVAAPHTFINSSGFEEEFDDENIEDNEDGHHTYIHTKTYIHTS